jgi:multicomponent Na+:H+ antiporter subunit D
MKEQLPALIVLIPLSVAALAPLIAYLSVRYLQLTVIGAIIASFISSVVALIRTLSEGPWSYWFGRWEPPWGIEYVIDPLSAGMAVLITFIAAVVAFYLGPFFSRGVSWLRKGILNSLYLLIITGLTGIVLTGDLFNLFVFIEISSIAAYALVASGGPRAAVSSFYYVLVGTVGASFYLLGVGFLYAMTGTLNMADLAGILEPLENSQAVIAAIVMMAVGMGLKMALFPMHGWLPGVYTYAPPPLTAFLAAVMGKVFAYVLLRLFFFIFGEGYGPVPAILNALGVAAAAGIIVASVMAVGQKDFRRMLAYSSVAQVGYIVLGLAIGNAVAIIGALLHMLNHAFMKCCLFFVAGGVKWKTGEHYIEKYVGLNKKMPLSMGALLIAAISMIGLPPAAGFFSKWYLAQGAIAAGMWHYVIVIVVGSLLSAVYFFKVIEHVYLKKPEKEENEGGRPVHTTFWYARTENPRSGEFFRELPAALLIPIIVMAVGILVLGIFNESIVTHVLQYALPEGKR